MQGAGAWGRRAEHEWEPEGHHPASALLPPQEQQGQGQKQPILPNQESKLELRKINENYFDKPF